ncbi:MAG: 1-deoxy-D-xylulose-5-phosphate synthase [Thermosediminibacterales bacterium]|nr:1-deoxy-D-xylulose-5-phosphate synthase [Thermosediminibacterales bacterium]
MSLLDKINSPQDLKNLSIDELEKLKSEIREELLEIVSKTGGHLASNLGVVELTIALHRVFESPKDKLIWDVGHQSYVHKLLTGRKKWFNTLRQYNGISGFPKRSESIHDVFETGHSSTSISAAVGMALARDLNSEKYSVVSIIGDGALTGGMAFEALNYAGHLNTDLIVVLNDNEMSISNNVGGLSSYLTRIRTDPAYYRVKADTEFLLKKIPAIGKTVAKTVERLKDSVKYFLVPGMLFEELGFTYLGPVDGHNIKNLIESLKMAKKTKGPVLLHVITSKGKGYKLAEENPNKFHGISPFNIKTGELLKKKGKTYSQIFGNTLVELAKANKKIVAITAAMPDGTGLKEFSHQFPDRFFDVGIAEQHATTMAAGLAAQGFKPVVAIYSTFLQRAFDQIIHDVCLQNLSVVFAVDRAGIVGEDGETHHGVFDLSYLKMIPNMVVMAPKDENELREMLLTAVEYNGPIAIRYPRGSVLNVEMDAEIRKIDIGKAEILKSGNDAAIIAIGSMVYPSLKAAEFLEKSGINVAVINSRFVKPLDEKLLTSIARKVKKIVTVEENSLIGGFGSAVLELLEKNRLFDIKIERMGLPDEFIKHGSRDILLKTYGLTSGDIIKKVEEIVG